MSVEDSLEALAVALTSSERDERFTALNELRQYSREQAVPLLLNVLADEDEYMRRRAVEALAGYKDIRAVEPLMAMLTDESWFVRQQAAEALGTLGDPRAIEALLAQLADHRGVSIVALAALTSFPVASVVQVFDRVCAYPTARLARGAVTFARGPWEDENLVPLLIMALADDDWRVRLGAVEALARRGDVRAVMPLLVMLDEQHPAVRYCVIAALGQLCDERAIAPLIRCLFDRDKQTRKAAVEALASFERQEVAQAFAKLLAEDPAVEVRSTLVAVLKRWNTEALSLLLLGLADQAPEVRCGAVQSLGVIGDTRATEPLIAVLAHEDLRAAAIQALGKLGDERALDPLLTQLFDREAAAEIRTFSAVALTSLHHPTVAQVFARVVTDPALRPLRSAVVLAFRQWDHEQSVPLLIMALSDEAWQVRWLAAQALARHHDPRALMPLLAALNDENISVRCGAIEALGKSGDQRVITPLLRQFSDKERRVRIAAAVALSAFHEPEVVQIFLTAFEHDPAKEVRAQMVVAFGQWKERQAIDPLVAALKKPGQDRDDRILLVQALAHIYHDKWLLSFLQPLIDHQGDSDDYIFSLPGGKVVRWEQAVDAAIDRVLRRSEEIGTEF